MKAINLLLEEDEIMLLRMQIRLMQIMLPESNEQVDGFIKKILDATAEAGEDTRKDIAKMQRAMRRIKETPFFEELTSVIKQLEKILIEEMEKENNLPNT